MSTGLPLISIARNTKEQLQNWYGKDFSKLQSVDELEALMQKHLADEDQVNLLFIP